MNRYGVRETSTWCIPMSISYSVDTKVPMENITTRSEKYLAVKLDEIKKHNPEIEYIEMIGLCFSNFTVGSGVDILSTLATTIASAMRSAWRRMGA